MNKIVIIIGLVACVFIISSCENKKNGLSKAELEEIQKFTPEFDSIHQNIYHKEIRKYDIKGEITVPFDLNNTKQIDIACGLTFFNYGDDIRLFNGCSDDFFVSGIGSINAVYVLREGDNIDIKSQKHNSKYGDWAIVDLFVGNQYVNDVFMTPQAMKAYNSEETDSFIFVQLVVKDKFMNVLFYGGPEECLIVSNCPNRILQSTDSWNIDGPVTGPGQFWHLIP